MFKVFSIASSRHLMLQGGPNLYPGASLFVSEKEKFALIQLIADFRFNARRMKLISSLPQTIHWGDEPSLISVSSGHLSHRCRATANICEALGKCPWLLRL